MPAKPPPRCPDPHTTPARHTTPFRQPGQLARRLQLAKLGAIYRAFWLGLWLVLKAGRLTALAEFHLHIPHRFTRAPRRWNTHWAHWFVRHWVDAGRRHRFAKASGIVGFGLAPEAICPWPADDETAETERPDE